MPSLIYKLSRSYPTFATLLVLAAMGVTAYFVQKAIEADLVSDPVQDLDHIVE